MALPVSVARTNKSNVDFSGRVPVDGRNVIKTTEWEIANFHL
jgi:hypothetical protein